MLLFCCWAVNASIYMELGCAGDDRRSSSVRRCCWHFIIVVCTNSMWIYIYVSIKCAAAVFCVNFFSPTYEYVHFIHTTVRYARMRSSCVSKNCVKKQNKRPYEDFDRPLRLRPLLFECNATINNTAASISIFAIIMGNESGEWVTVGPSGGKGGSKNNRHRNGGSRNSKKNRPRKPNKFTGAVKRAQELAITDDISLDKKLIHQKLVDLMDELERSKKIHRIFCECLRSACVYVPRQQQEQKSNDNIESSQPQLSPSSSSEGLTMEEMYIEDIVCYGIGCFYKAQPIPMLQLACALLLRNHLCRRGLFHDDGDKAKAAHEENDVNIYFYEPLMKPVEREVLEMFHVRIIETNEQGKRCIRERNNNRKATLFYMPHCPMRLYSNVVWANWGVNLAHNVVILGNSFAAYDNRTVKRTEREDASNCVFRSLPYTRELALELKNIDVDYFEEAFNDSCVIRFCLPRSDDDGTDGSSRSLSEISSPPEYFTRPDDYELL